MTLTGSPREESVRVWSEDGLAVVTPLSQVNAGNAQQFWAALASVTQDHSVIVADLSGQQDCDWHAMGALMMALRYTDASGGELRVAAGSPEVRQVLTESGLDRLVAVFGTLAEAMPRSHPPLEPGLPGVEQACTGRFRRGGVHSGYQAGLLMASGPRADKYLVNRSFPGKGRADCAASSYGSRWCGILVSTQRCPDGLGRSRQRPHVTRHNQTASAGRNEPRKQG